MIRCRVYRAGVLFLFLVVLPVPLFGQDIVIVPRQDYYTTETSAEILFYVKDMGGMDSLAGEVFNGDTSLIENSPLHQGMNRITIKITGLRQGKYPLQCIVKDNSGNILIDTRVYLTILSSRPNEVKTDRLTGTLIVQGLPYIPFGFYAYSPVYPTLPEEEVVRGFNMMSPYQRIEKKTFKQRKAYMDRCAQLGMKVNYNLLSVAGGGGVGSKMDVTAKGKRDRLIREVLAFRNHPALLSWYIADEPVGQGRPPEPLIETYKLIKKLDPYHPVTMVFMTPQEAWRYAGAMDIVMADPYPIPNRPVTEVENVTRLLKQTFYPAKPLWIVPQAFGGAENWKREPTPSEIRVMTYLALINGARGIQYFVRNGMNGFPKSVATWDECGKMALETAELTPYYCQGHEVSGITTDNKNVRIKVLSHDSSLVIICVNTLNQPAALSVSLPDTIPAVEAEVMFENRKIKVVKHLVSDMIDAYGTRVYRISLQKAPVQATGTPVNMMVDPGFEYLPVPGVPSAAYARVGEDRGATYFVDSRVFHSGEHSVRFVTPEDGKGAALSFFPAYLEYGRTYCFSIWAKAAPRENLQENKGILWRLFHRKRKPGPPSFTVNASSAGTGTFSLTGRWKKYEMFITPGDSTQYMQRTSLTLSLDTRGTAWFDDLCLAPVLDMKTTVAVRGKSIKITLLTTVDSTQIRYDTQGQMPGPSSPVYESPFLINHDADMVAAAFRNGKQIGTYRQALVVDKALGKDPELKNLFSARYDAGGFGGLTDGLLAEASFRDPAWQGYLKDDLVATIDLDSVQEISEIETGFLQQIRWYRIFFPVGVDYYVSENGRDYTLVYSQPGRPPVDEGPEVERVTWKGEPVRGRFVRVVARNMGVVPDGFSGAGGKAWLFCDEIIIK